MTFRPLLAEKADLDNINYPVLGSPKYDGFRCIITAGGLPMSRNMKPIRNSFVYGKLREMSLPQFDGELLTYTNGKLDDFNVVQSKLSSQSGMPEFKYMVFDEYSQPNADFQTRSFNVRGWFDANPGNKYLDRVFQVQLNNQEEMLDFEATCLSQGWEGIMLRSFEGKYKMGRSTVKEGILLKVKRFFDDEATIIGFTELQHNANEAVENVLGYTERSSHKDNMVGMGVLGKFTVSWGTVEFDIGTGFDQNQREQYWKDQKKLMGKTITFKYQSLGPNGKPRFPVFLGFRNDA